jgi:hypothetical protein
MAGFPLLSLGDNSSTLAGANAFTESGDAIHGHLAVDDEGHVVFVPDDPDHDPEKE